MKNIVFSLLLTSIALISGCSEDEESVTPSVTPSATVDTTPATLAIDVKGYVQKGPFINGTSMIITELDDSLAATGKTFTTQIADNQGAFFIKTSQLDHTNLQLIASGFYFDEVQGEKSAAQLTLFALANVSQDATINVNVLSHLEFNRVMHLMQKKGESLGDAKKQAQQEVLALFGIQQGEVRSSELLDIAKDGEDNAMLLAISAVLQAHNTVAELSELLANISTDLREDGVLNSQSSKDKIREQAKLLDLPRIRQNLEQRYQEMDVEATIPVFERYVDSDGDGILNKDEDDTPDDFTFEPQINVAVDTLVISNEITIGGLKDGGKSIARIEGGTLIVNDQEVTADSTQISNGDRVKLVLRSSSEYATPSVAKLTINTLVRPFSVTTDDYTPDDFSFTMIENAQRDSLYTSETIILSGLPHATPISLDEGTLLINGQIASGDRNSVKNGDKIAVRFLASSEYETAVTAILHIGTISKTFKIHTKLNPWQRKADVPVGDSYKIYSIVIQDKIYRINFSSSSINIYDPEKNEWTGKSTNIPSEFEDNRSNIARFALGDKAYFGLGGYTDHDYNNDRKDVYTYRDFWEYNPTTNLWIRKADFPGENINGATGFVINNQGYITAGYYDDPNYEEDYYEDYIYSRQLWKYDPLNDQWTRKADFPGKTRRFAAGFGFNGKGYLGGGNKGVEIIPVEGFWKYDPIADSWTEKANFTEQLPLDSWGYGACAFFSINGTLYFMATHREINFKKYDAIHDSWTDVELLKGNDWYSLGIISDNQKAYISLYRHEEPYELWEFTPPEE